MLPSDAWPEKYGEAMTKVQAARVLGISRPTVYEHIKRGLLLLTADGRVSTRSAAEYCEPRREARTKAINDNERLQRFRVE
jgi:excisionase family DNA binding protein